ncbi:putative GPI-anchored protein pfl2 isoform X2 [Drosophila obscura]|uniref:putative GPI-anchored protein pfl2 isoform X2 n=1 Tax=Drosophila obscura TaxID=7282 RepID=UPI001BB0EE4C|nr:putative GPI-anchored protein pfl2 isoform X2 [Drosophila obscura]
MGIHTSDLTSLLSTSEEKDTEPYPSVPFTTIEPPEDGQTGGSPPVSEDATEKGILTSDLANLLSTSEEKDTETYPSVPFTTIEPPEDGQTGGSPPVSEDATEKGILTSDLANLFSTSEEKDTEPYPSVPFTTIEPPEDGQTGGSPTVSVDATERGILTLDLTHLLSTSEEKRSKPYPSVPFTTIEPHDDVQIGGSPPVSVGATEMGIFTSDLNYFLSTSQEKSTEPDYSELLFTTIEPPEDAQIEESPPVSVDATERGILTSDLTHLLSTSEEKRSEPYPSVPFTTMEPREDVQSGGSPPVSEDATEKGILTSDLANLLSTPEEKDTEPYPSVLFTTIEPPEDGQTGGSPPVSEDATEKGILTSDLANLLSTPEENDTEPYPSVLFTTMEPPEDGQTGGSLPDSEDSTEKGILTSDLINLLSTPEEKDTEPYPSVPFTTIEPPEDGQTGGSPRVSEDATEKGILTSDLANLLSTSEEKDTEPYPSVPFTRIEPPEDGQTGGSPRVSEDATEKGILTSDLANLLSTSEEKDKEPYPSVPFTTIEPPEDGQTGGSPPVSEDATEKGILTSDLANLLSTSEEKDKEPYPSVPFTTIEPPEDGQTGGSPPVSVDATDKGIPTSDLINLLSTSEEKDKEPYPSVPFTTIEPPADGQTGVSPLVSEDATEKGILTSDLANLLSTSEEKDKEPYPSVPFTTIEPPGGGQPGGPPPGGGQPGGPPPGSGQPGGPPPGGGQPGGPPPGGTPHQYYATPNRYKIRPPLRICYDVKYKHKRYMYIHMYVMVVCFELELVPLVTPKRFLRYLNSTLAVP